MKRLLLAAGMSALFTLSASAQDATSATGQRQPPAQGQKSQGSQPKSGPVTSQPQAKAPLPSKQPPTKSVQTPPPPVHKSGPPPQQKTIILQPLPSVIYQRSYGYSERRHSFCQRKAWELFQYERHAAADGYISRRERSIINDLKDELGDKCGGFRWRG